MTSERRSDTPDLQTQLESLFDQVWQSEADWQLWDRIEVMAKLEAAKKKRESLKYREPRSDLGR